MINNVDLVISYRSTQSSSGSGYYRSRGSKDYPLMLIAYDSRVDKISKLTNMFHLLHPSVELHQKDCVSSCYERN